MTDLVFSLDIEKGDKQSYLVLHVTDKNFPSRIPYADAFRDGKGFEKDLFTFLYKQIKGSLSTSSVRDDMAAISIKKIRIPPLYALECIKLLALAKKLQWKGTSLFFNPLSRCEVCFEAMDEREKLHVSGYLLFEKRKIPFSKVLLLFLADTSWCIADQCVMIFSSAVDKRLVSKVYPHPLVLEGKKREEFIDTYRDEKEQSITWQGALDSAMSGPMDPLSAFPVLVLQDMHGVFANLYMDYGSKGRIAMHDRGGSFRDSDLEKSWEKDLLETGFQKKSVGSSHYYCPSSEVKKTLSFLLELGWKVIDYKGREVLRQGKKKIEMSEQSDCILITGSVNYDTHTADLHNVIGAFLRQDRFVELSPFAVGLIDDDRGLDFHSLKEGQLKGGGVRMPMCKAGLIAQLWNDKECHFDLNTSSLLQRLEEAKSMELMVPSFDFCGSLYPYQQEGVNWMGFLQKYGLHGLLADEMGLGKTVQVLAFLSTLTQRKEPVLIVAPTSLVFHWKKELEKFLPAQRVYIYGAVHRFSDAAEVRNFDIIITSYAYMRIDVSFFQKILFAVMILDEAQTIKNPQSQVAMAAFSLAARMKIAITGTPIENTVDDLWSLFHFLEKELLGTRSDFRAQMLSMESDDRHRKLLKKKISPFILRRTKEMVGLDLPEKILQTIYVEMAPDQKEIYENFIAHSRSSLMQLIHQEGVGKRRLEVLEAILRLRQICCHPYLVDKQQNKRPCLSGKVERIVSDILEVVALGKKVILFSQFTQMLKLFQTYLTQENISYVYLDGSTEDRQSVVQEFQQNTSVPVFLMSLKAGGVGLNLTAADYVFLCDPWWNDAVERQAIDRAHRLGRKGAVVARRYITAESIEEKMVKLKEHKSVLAEGLVQGDHEFSPLTLEELTALFY